MNVVSISPSLLFSVCLLHSVLPFVLLLMFFSLLIEPKMPTELGLCAFAEAKQLLSNLLRFDLSLTVMGTNVLSSRGSC